MTFSGRTTRRALLGGMQLESLTRDAIVSAIAAGRTYIAESSQVALKLSAQGGGRTAGIGERLPVSPSTPVTDTAEVSGVPNGVVRFITDEGQLLQSQLSSSGVGSVTWTTTGQQSTYVRVEVRHPLPDGTPGNGNGMGPVPTVGPMAALTNPIWLDR